MRPTVPPIAPPDDAEPAEEQGGEQGAEASPPARARTRTRRPSPAGKLKARNLHLTDDVHDRLFYLARQRRTTVSAVANDVLDKALPRWDVKRTG